MLMTVRQIRSVGTEFAESAPVRLVFSTEIAAPPAAVYRALAEETGDWPEWFTAMSAARATPGGREVRLRMGGSFTETVLVAEPDVRYVYRVESTAVPGRHALLEEWLLAPAGAGGTRVRWTYAVDGTGALRLFMRAFRPGLARTFAESMRRLERRPAGAPPPAGE